MKKNAGISTGRRALEDKHLSEFRRFVRDEFTTDRKKVRVFLNTIYALTVVGVAAVITYAPGGIFAKLAAGILLAAPLLVLAAVVTFGIVTTTMIYLFKKNKKH